MSRGLRGLALALAVAGVAVLAVVVVTRPPDGATPTDPPPSSPVEGVVIRVDAQGLGDVRSFTLRTLDGRQLTFTLDRLENATEFPPGHLTEHVADSAPVRVTFVVDGSTLAATRLDDAT
jgi:hypothetical protein